MRLLFSLLLIASLTVGWTLQAQAAEANWDAGPIDAINDDYLYIEGGKGRHVLQMIGDCSWCTLGLQVLIRFQPFRRATVTPYPGTERGHKVRTLVVRDGRYDE